MSNIYKNTTIYSISSILQRGMGIIMMPIYTYYLTVEGYGTIALINSLIPLFSIIFSLSINQAIIKFYNDKNIDRVLLIQTAFIVTFTSSTFFMIICILFNDLIFNIILNNISFYPYMAIGLLSVYSRPIFLLYLSVLQAKQSSKKVAIYNICFFISNSILIVIMLIIIKNIIAPIIATAAVNILFASFTSYQIIKKYGIGFNYNYFLTIIRYVFPIIPSNLSNWMVGTIDRIIINLHIGPSSLGIYNVGFQIGSSLGFITGANQTAYLPWYNKLLNTDTDTYNNNKNKFINNSVELYCIMAVLISLLSPFIIKLLVSNQNYYSAHKIIPFIVFAMVFQGIYFFAVAPIYYHNTNIVLIITIIVSILSLSTTFFFVKYLGIYGAAIANLINKIILSVITVIIGRKYDNNSYIKIYIIAILSLLTVLASKYLLLNNILLYIIVTVLIIMLITNNRNSIMKLFIREL